MVFFEIVAVSALAISGFEFVTNKVFRSKVEADLENLKSKVAPEVEKVASEIKAKL